MTAELYEKVKSFPSKQLIVRLFAFVAAIGCALSGAAPHGVLIIRDEHGFSDDGLMGSKL